MELHTIAIRVLFAYIFLQILLRLSGKRTVTQAGTFNCVLAIILGDMMDDAMWGEVPIAQFVVGTGALVLVQLVVSLASYHSPKIAAILEGNPDLFMKNGSLVRKGLRRERVSRREAEEMLRLAEGLEEEDWKQVRSAQIEESGEPSAILHEWARPAQKSDRDRLREVKP